MTYITAKKVIENKRKVLSDQEWTEFAQETADKLDVFLLNNRITEGQYNELSESLKEA